MQMEIRFSFTPTRVDWTIIRSLTHIRRKLDENICDHDHLMTDAWGGHELSERTLEKDERLVHHVKIYGWTPEWIEKRHLKT